MPFARPVQIDRLVQLLETPVFTFLRLHLLQPTQYPALSQCEPPPLARPCVTQSFNRNKERV